MGLIDLQRIEHRPDVVARALLRIFLLILRHIRRWIAAGVEGDAAVVFREVADLLLPRAKVAGKFMDKEDRHAFAGLFVEKLHSIVSCEMRHEIPVQKAWARAERPASIVTTEPLV